MTWLAAHWPALASLAISLAALGVSIRYHCKQDDERFGRVMERLGMKE